MTGETIFAQSSSYNILNGRHRNFGNPQRATFSSNLTLKRGNRNPSELSDRGTGLENEAVGVGGGGLGLIDSD